MKKFVASNILFLIILGAVVFCLYGKSIKYGLTYIDDDTLTIKNIDYISDYKNIPDFFVNGCYYLDRVSPYYRPILNLSFSLESILFGYNLKIYHTTNILLFILSLYLIFLFLRRLNCNSTILKCLIILFSVHPILTSVPTWLPARNDSLLTVFFISSLIFFIDYINTKKIHYFFLYIFFYALALFTKETALPLIIIYFLLTFYPFTSSPFKIKQKLLNSLCFLAIIAIYFFLRHNDTVGNPDIVFYIKNSLIFSKNIILGLMIYIKQLIFPNYMPVIMYNISLDVTTITINLIVFISLAFVYYKKLLDRKIILFSLIFFFLSVFPTFLQTEYALLFHRLIIVLPAILLIIVPVIEKILSLFPETKKYFILIFVLLIPILSYASFNQADKYKNSFIFWSEAYNDAPNYHLTPDGLSKEYRKIKDYKKALELEKEAVDLNGLSLYYTNYAIIQYEMGQKEYAKENFLRIIQQTNKYYLPYKYLSKIYLQENNKEKAIEYAKKAIESAPDKEKATLTEYLNIISN